MEQYQATCALFPERVVSHPADENHFHILLLRVALAIIVLGSVVGGSWLEQAVQVPQDEPVCACAENAGEHYL